MHRYIITGHLERAKQTCTRRHLSPPLDDFSTETSGGPWDNRTAWRKLCEVGNRVIEISNDDEFPFDVDEQSDTRIMQRNGRGWGGGGWVTAIWICLELQEEGEGASSSRLTGA